MGTNYYLKTKSNVCEHCGRGDESDRLHIGKSSGGWCFSLHVDPSENINDLADWIERWDAPNSVIEDEYGSVVTRTEMLEKIIERSWPTDGTRGRMTPKELTTYLDANNAIVGPNNLLRCRIGSHCVGHGEGTWDLIRGEFS